MRLDDESTYPLWCRFAGHRWRRPYYPADYEASWSRPKSCHRCAHILKGTALIAARWEQANEAKRLAGCRCGKPATEVRFFGSSATWSCEEHRGINQWYQVLDGPWIPVEPTAEEAASLARWETLDQRPYNEVDKIRGGAYEVTQ